MSKKIGQIERKSKRGSRIGTFIFGWFIGFILTLGLIGGTVAFAYFKVSPQWLNDKFNAGIDLGNEDLNKLTLNKAVNHAISLVNNIDTYTLNDLKTDFGISLPDTLSGIDISDLKNVALPQIAQALQNKLANISAKELDGVLNFGSDLDQILNKQLKLYLYNNRLYSDQAHTKLLDIDFVLNGSTVKIKGENYDFSSGSATVGFKDLPIVNAITIFANSLGDNLTLKQLEDDFGITLPALLDSVDKANTTINQLEDVIMDLKVANILGYYEEEGKYYEDSSKATEITGIMATLAGKKVNELSSLDELVDDVTIAEVLGYYEEGGKYYEDSSKATEITGIMATLAGYKVGELSSNVSNITVAEIMDYTVNGSIVKDKDNNDVTGIMKKIAPLSLSELDDIASIVDDMTIAEVLGYNIDGDDVTDSQGNDVTGVMKVLATTTVSNLTTRVGSLTISEVMGYYEEEGHYYEDSSKTTEISGIMAALAPCSVNNLNSKIETLTLGDVFTSTDLSSGIFTLLDSPSSVAINNISSAFSSAVTDKTLQQFGEAGLIDATSEDLSKTITYNGNTVTIGSLKINELVNFVLQIASL